MGSSAGALVKQPRRGLSDPRDVYTRPVRGTIDRRDARPQFRRPQTRPRPSSSRPQLFKCFHAPLPAPRFLPAFPQFSPRVTPPPGLTPKTKMFALSRLPALGAGKRRAGIICNRPRKKGLQHGAETNFSPRAILSSLTEKLDFESLFSLRQCFRRSGISGKIREFATTGVGQGFVGKVREFLVHPLITKTSLIFQLFAPF